MICRLVVLLRTVGCCLLGLFLQAGLAGAETPVQQQVQPQAPTQATPAPAPEAALKEVQLAKDAFTLGDPVPGWVEPATAPTPGPSAGKPPPLLIRLADTQFMVGADPVVHLHSAMTVNDASLLTEAGRISIPFVPQYQRLQLHGVTVLRGAERMDRTATSTVRFLQREKGLEQGIYSDVVTASILVNDLRVGDTLEYSYSLTGQNPVFAGKFADYASWDPPGPTMLRRVVLNHPVDRKITWRVVGPGPAGQIVPEETVDGGMRKLRFTATNVSGVAEEQQIPPDFIPYRLLQFSEFATWDDVVAWAAGLFETGGTIPDELRQAVERIRALPTADEKVAAALKFVQGEIRYFSVSLGENSHRPASPDVVLQRRYGDCKDKSTLLVTMLRELGIESHPVLLKSGGRKLMDNLLPGPQFFDHAIVQAVLPGGRAYYLDPTRLGQYGRLDRMGQVHEGTRVLVIAKANGGPSTIASPNAQELTRSEVVEKASIARLGGDGQLSVRQVWNGANAEMMRVVMEQVPADQLAKAFGNILEPRYPGAALRGEPKVEDDRTKNSLVVTTEYTVPKMAFDRDGNWFVRYAPTNLQGVLVPSPAASRSGPLHLPMFPFNGTYTFEVAFPEQVSVMSDPRGDSVRSKFFSISSTTSFRGQVSKTRIDMQTLADRIEPKDLKKYSEDVRSIDKVIIGVVIVPKQFVRAKSAPSALKTELSRSLRDRQLQDIDTATMALKSGRLSDTDKVAALCGRSSAYGHLDKHDNALKDANEAIKASSGSADAMTCRASAYFGAGQFEKSVEDYTGALSLGAADARIFHQRGISKFYAGRLDDAAEDFARASAGVDKGYQVFADLWLAWTLQRLGKPLPEDLVQRAAAEARNDWPNPALATLAGHITPDEMLKVIDGKLGDERQMAMVEGYFFLGQHHLARGEAVKAKEYFTKARQLQIVTYTEHIAAGFELKAMSQGTVATGALPKTAPTAVPPVVAIPAAAPANAIAPVTAKPPVSAPAVPATAVAPAAAPAATAQPQPAVAIAPATPTTAPAPTVPAIAPAVAPAALPTPTTAAAAPVVLPVVRTPATATTAIPVPATIQPAPATAVPSAPAAQPAVTPGTAVANPVPVAPAAAVPQPAATSPAAIAAPALPPKPTAAVAPVPTPAATPAAPAPVAAQPQQAIAIAPATPTTAPAAAPSAPARTVPAISPAVAPAAVPTPSAAATAPVVPPAAAPTALPAPVAPTAAQSATTATAAIPVSATSTAPAAAVAPTTVRPVIAPTAPLATPSPTAAAPAAGAPASVRAATAATDVVPATPPATPPKRKKARKDDPNWNTNPLGQ